MSTIKIFFLTLICSFLVCDISIAQFKKYESRTQFDNPQDYEQDDSTQDDSDDGGNADSGDRFEQNEQDPKPTTVRVKGIVVLRAWRRLAALSTSG